MNEFTRLLLIILISFGIGCKTKTSVPVQKNVSEFQNLLDQFSLSGSLLIYDPVHQTYYSNDFKWANKKHLPASTFKIPNSIIALELGSVSNDSTILEWDQHPRQLAIWEQDLTFKQAFQSSCVPCYQELARKAGVKQMRHYLDKLHYPGMHFDSASVDNFWLEGVSKISQFEQIQFLERLYASKLPIHQNTEQVLKTLLKIEETDSYTLYAKTGWGVRNGANNGWYVGFIEHKDGVHFFATNVNPNKNLKESDFLNARILFTKAALKWFLKF